jgi:hypothetical protein
MWGIVTSVESAMPLKNRHSLKLPFGPPSPLPPLSEVTTIKVLSSSPDSSRWSSTRPSWSSV